MSETPRTDALIDRLCPFLEGDVCTELEAHARQIEREAVEWKSRWKDAIDDASRAFGARDDARENTNRTHVILDQVTSALEAVMRYPGIRDYVGGEIHDRCERALALRWARV